MPGNQPTQERPAVNDDDDRDLQGSISSLGSLGSLIDTDSEVSLLTNETDSPSRLRQMFDGMYQSTASASRWLTGSDGRDTTGARRHIRFDGLHMFLAAFVVSLFIYRLVATDTINVNDVYDRDWRQVLGEAFTLLMTLVLNTTNRTVEGARILTRPFSELTPGLNVGDVVLALQGALVLLGAGFGLNELRSRAYRGLPMGQRTLPSVLMDTEHHTTQSQMTSRSGDSHELLEGDVESQAAQDSHESLGDDVERQATQDQMPSQCMLLRKPAHLLRHVRMPNVTPYAAWLTSFTFYLMCSSINNGFPNGVAIPHHPFNGTAVLSNSELDPNTRVIADQWQQLQTVVAEFVEQYGPWLWATVGTDVAALLAHFVNSRRENSERAGARQQHLEHLGRLSNPTSTYTFFEEHPPRTVGEHHDRQAALAIMPSPSV